MSVHEGEFGTCCKDLKDAMEQPPNRFFRADDNGILDLTVGYMNTEQGPGFYDQAVLFCPFCGKPLQTRENIAAKVNAR